MIPTRRHGPRARPETAPACRLPASLRAARLQAGLSQAEAARVAGVSVRTLRNYETGRTHPRPPWLGWVIGAIARLGRAL